MAKISKILTEKRNKETLDIDNVSTLEMLSIINKQDQKVAIAVKTQLKQIAKVVEYGAEVIKKGGRIIYFGAGTSGRLGILDASEMLPTFGEKDWFIAIIAGGKNAITAPVENAEDSKTKVVKDLKKVKVSKKDLLIGIAASGVTPYVLAGICYGRKIGSKTVAISTSPNSLIGKAADFKIEAVTGPETITGSTRMKSGTAQKMILNMISTGIMITLGKTYSNWMVDLKPTNAKLMKRATNMIKIIANVDEQKAKQLLKDSKFNVKIALVMHEKKVNLIEAKKILEKNNNKLKGIL